MCAADEDAHHPDRPELEDVRPVDHPGREDVRPVDHPEPECWDDRPAWHLPAGTKAQDPKDPGNEKKDQ